MAQVAPYRTPDRRQTSKRGFRTKREAETFAATVKVAKLSGEYVARHRWAGPRLASWPTVGLSASSKPPRRRTTGCWNLPIVSMSSGAGVGEYGRR
ncbi:Arm DNA-binding domain-containing protein [Mycobacterium haemophilum]|uniref:Arm DNA-binding domain-containing protein n=1 Tax=Mycobacterium haemophilum TaxID=29311 RepID=UPI00069A063C|nr:Arm DNA-binding domain-containing protein [Mycobacterium haemophilum]